jgi:hypothetical protein
MTITINADGLVRIPEVFRESDAIEAGQRFEIARLGRGEYRLRAEQPRGRSSAGLVDLLLACPVKGFFTEPERTETTNDLAPMSFE